MTPTEVDYIPLQALHTLLVGVKAHPTSNPYGVKAGWHQVTFKIVLVDLHVSKSKEKCPKWTKLNVNVKEKCPKWTLKSKF